MAQFPSKYIIVVHNDMIPELQYIYGPIMSPFWCEIPIIEQMVHSGKRVYEILPDGTRILLTRFNYNLDNGGGTPPTPEPPVPPNNNIPSEHLKQKLESNAGIHGSLRYLNGRFEKYNKNTALWEPAYNDDKYTLDGVSQVAVGGIRQGMNFSNMTMDEIIYRLTHPVAPPVLELTLDPSDILFEKGYSLDSLTLNLNVIKGGLDLVYIHFLKDNDIISSPTVINDPSSDYTYTHSTPILTDAVLKAIVSDGEGDIIASKAIQFIEPKLTGYVDSAAVIDPTILSGLTKLLDLSDTITVSNTVTDQKVCFATLATNDITGITDENGFDIMHLFEKHEMQYTLLDGTLADYNVYITIDPMTVVSFDINYTFN